MKAPEPTRRDKTMTNAATELSLSTDDLEYAWGICREKARNPDFRFSPEDVTPQLGVGATHYAMRYTGTFEFMQQMRQEAMHRPALTPAQAKGVLNCMLADARRQVAAAAPRETVDMTALMTLFQRAGARLRNPRITLNGVVLKLMTRGQHPGSINLGSNAAWPNSIWYGRVEPNGQLTTGRAMTPAVLELIRELAADPVAAARRYASLTGNCCFCNLALTTPESVTAGYGPVCAGHYGLPWGNRQTPQEAEGAMRHATGTAPAQTAREMYSERPEGYTHPNANAGYFGAEQRVQRSRRNTVRTPQVAPLEGMTPLGMQASAIVTGHPVTSACGDCPAWRICSANGVCEGAVVD